MAHETKKSDTGRVDRLISDLGCYARCKPKKALADAQSFPIKPVINRAPMVSRRRDSCRRLLVPLAPCRRP